jgi:hypothetical protein
MKEQMRRTSTKLQSVIWGLREVHGAIPTMDFHVIEPATFGHNLAKVIIELQTAVKTLHTLDSFIIKHKPEVEK